MKLVPIWNNLLLFMSRQLRRLLVWLFQWLSVVRMLPKLWQDICISSLIRGIQGTPLFLSKISVKKSLTFGGTIWKPCSGHPLVRCNIDNQNDLRIIQFSSMVKELQDIALDIYRFTSCSQIQLDINWIPHDQNSHAQFFFSVRLLILTIVLLLMKWLFISKSSGARILLIDLLAVTTLNCPGLIPDSFSQD